MTAEIQSKFEKVMIIDDNNIDLYITKRLIIKNNFGKEVLPFDAAEEAIKYLQDNQENISLLPQIIFTDIYMPGMSGFKFLEAYDELTVALKKYCKVFIISSTIDDKDIERSRLDKNLTAFQVKPITKEFLDGISAE
jgi:CheY-like chemotaxis protein